MIWSSCLAPVPPIFILPGPAFFAASMYSFGVLYGVFALTHSTKLSSASICTGVRSRQLNGTPVASGVVNRLDSVMMILCGSPDAPFTSRKPSAPAPPDLLIGSSDCFIRPCFATMPWIARAIWSAPPPVPAGMMNSTFLVGSHASPWVGHAAAIANATATSAALRKVSFMPASSLKLCRFWRAAARAALTALNKRTCRPMRLRCTAPSGLPVHEHRYLRLRQHFLRFAPEHRRSAQAVAPVRCHEDQVAAALFRLGDDRVGRKIARHVRSVAPNAGLAGRLLDPLEIRLRRPQGHLLMLARRRVPDGKHRLEDDRRRRRRRE